jgi:hypothetical protein
MTEIFSALKAPFDPSLVSWRVGSMNKEKTKGMALAYIDARDVMERLDTVVGPENWQCRYPHANGKTVCAIGIKIGDEWIWKEDGAGDSDIEAEKGALSDAFKRAAVRWGIGRYLYDIASPWVEVDQWKHIKDSEMLRLERLLAQASGLKPAAPKPEVVVTSGPAKSFEPAVSTAAVSLVRELKGCKSIPDFDAMKRQPEFIQAYRAMNETDRNHVNAEAAKHRAAIEANDLKMAG